MTTHVFNVYRPIDGSGKEAGVIVATDDAGKNAGVVDLIAVNPDYRNVISASSLMRHVIQEAAVELNSAEWFLEQFRSEATNARQLGYIDGLMVKIADVTRMLENANLAAEIGIEQLHIQLQKGLHKKMN